MKILSFKRKETSNIKALLFSLVLAFSRYDLYILVLVSTVCGQHEAGRGQIITSLHKTTLNSWVEYGLEITCVAFFLKCAS